MSEERDRDARDRLVEGAESVLPESGDAVNAEGESPNGHPEPGDAGLQPGGKEEEVVHHGVRLPPLLDGAARTRRLVRKEKRKRVALPSTQRLLLLDTWRRNRLPEVTRRAVLILKEDNPDWGCRRVSEVLARGPSPSGGRRASVPV